MFTYPGISGNKLSFLLQNLLLWSQRLGDESKYKFLTTLEQISLNLTLAVIVFSESSICDCVGHISYVNIYSTKQKNSFETGVLKDDKGSFSVVILAIFAILQSFSLYS